MTRKLSMRLKEFGKAFLEELDNTIYRPTAMLWTNSFKQDDWVLVIGTMIARVPENISIEDFNERQDKMADDIKKLILDSPLEDPKFKFVTMSPAHNFLLNLGSVVNTDIDSSAQIEINNSTIDGNSIGDSYIYRLYVGEDRKEK